MRKLIAPPMQVQDDDGSVHEVALWVRDDGVVVITAPDQEPQEAPPIGSRAENEETGEAS